jgi:hypothetical protein
MKKALRIFGLLLLSFSINSVYAQKGTVKIFSELKPIKVYLNEELKGVDIITLDSVSSGSHYLKITKDEVIVYGEIIQVKAGEVTTILIKDSKENKDKLLQSKFKEIQEYKDNRLEVLMSTNYVTSTTGVTKSTYYPGYYIATGVSRSNIQSSTTAVTDWFISQGGVKKVAEPDFARMVNHQAALASYAADVSGHKSHVKSRFNAGCITGGIFWTGGTAFLIMGIRKKENAYLFPAGLFYLITLGAINIMDDDGKYPWKKHYMTVDDAVKYANEYNQNLKKRLGLPENFELQ